MADAAAAPGSYTLGIESGLKYLQTQHLGECVYDSFQMILTFADGLRGINAWKAQELFNADPVGLLTVSDSYKSQIGQFMFDVKDEMSLQAYISANPDIKPKSFIHFYALMLRRYVLIKLQECKWSSKTLESYFKIPSGGIQTICPGIPKFSSPVLKREPSLNTEGSTYAALKIMNVVGMTPEFNAGRIATKGSMIDQINAIARVFNNLPILKNDFVFTTTYRGDKENTKLIGIAITAVQPGAGHENCIVRYQGKYYYCDNEIGVAQVINSELFNNLEKNSFTYGSEEGKGYFFKINDKVAFHDPKRFIDGGYFKSNHLVFVYAKSEPVYGPEDKCTFLPPEQNNSVALTAAEPKLKFIAGTVLDGQRNFLFSLKESRNMALPTLRGTRRAGRPFLQFMEASAGSSGGALVKTRKQRRRR